MNISPEKSLLAHIAAIFVREKERAATEALKYILMRSEQARNVLRDILCSAGVEVDPLSRFQTEAIGEQSERVDLVCYDRDGTERVLVETKFWADLTDNQPNTYLDRLNKNVPSALVFVVPVSRVEALWPEILSRCRKNLRVVPVQSDGNIRVAALGNRPGSLMLTSWGYLLNEMTEGCGEKIKSDIEQLRGLTETMEHEKFIPLESGDLSSEIPTKLRGLRLVVDGAIDRAREQDWIREQEGKIAQSVEYGRYIYLSEVGVWFGVDFESWKNQGTTPLWVHLNEEHLPDDEAVLRRFKRNKTIPMHKAFESYCYFPIDLPVGNDLTAVITSVVEQLNGIARLINRSMPKYRRH